MQNILPTLWFIPVFQLQNMSSKFVSKFVSICPSTPPKKRGKKDIYIYIYIYLFIYQGEGEGGVAKPMVSLKPAVHVAIRRHQSGTKWAEADNNKQSVTDNTGINLQIVKNHISVAVYIEKKSHYCIYAQKPVPKILCQNTTTWQPVDSSPLELCSLTKIHSD